METQLGKSIVDFVPCPTTSSEVELMETQGVPLLIPLELKPNNFFGSRINGNDLADIMANNTRATAQQLLRKSN